MSDLPTTAEVRHQFIAPHFWNGELDPDLTKSKAAFDNWLSAIQAEAWDEGKEDTMRGLDIHGDTNAENPYRKEQEDE